MVVFRMIASWIYGIAVGLRNLLYDEKVLRSSTVAIPTICVGNLAVGGTGKTPHTEYLLGLLQGRFKVAVLSRGYKRKTKGFRLADEHSTAVTIGDEPMQIHLNFPNAIVAVSENRVHGIHKLMQLYPDLQVIILDDAYQHRSLRCGFELLLTSADNLFTNDHLLPWGRLREDARQSSRAAAVVVTKCPDTMRPIDKRIIDTSLKLLPYQRLYFSKMQYGEMQPVFTSVEPDSVAEPKRPLILAGIANPLPFIDFLHRTYPNAPQLLFGDHHAFSKRDMQRLEQLFNNERCDAIITTQKDAVRLVETPSFPDALKLHTFFVPITVDFAENTEMFNNQIISYVTENNRNR